MTKPQFAARGPAIRYAKIARHLQEAISRGEYPVGSYLPTEHALCILFDASRFTIRAALTELSNRGLIHRKPSLGTVVVAAEPKQVYAEGYASIDEMLQVTAGATLQVASFGDVVIASDAATHLRTPVGSAFFRLEGLRFDPTRKAARPLGWAEVYVDPMYSGIRDDLIDAKSSIAHLIERRYGQRVVRIDQEITAIWMPGDLATRLDATADEPALELRRWYSDKAGAVFEIARNVFPLDRFVYRTHLMRHPTTTSAADR